MSRLLTVIEIAEAVEAILQLFGPAPLLIKHRATGSPPAPLEMRSYIVVPALSAKSAPEPVVRIRLDLRDAGVNLAARPLAFDIAPPIVGTKLEGKAPIVKAEGLRVGRSGRCQNSGYGQTNRKNAHHVPRLQLRDCVTGRLCPSDRARMANTWPTDESRRRGWLPVANTASKSQRVRLTLARSIICFALPSRTAFSMNMLKCVASASVAFGGRINS